MPQAEAGMHARPDVDWLFRRLVWVLTSLTILGAGIAYAGKAADNRSAFVRWRHQVHMLWDGVNIYDTLLFPNPPIMPITLAPFMALPKLPGALSWFAFKIVITAFSAWFCFDMVRKPGAKSPLPSWVIGPTLLLSLRPILSDLHHGNNNLLILFVVVASLQAWRKGYDVLSGILLALAIAYKVTPALFVPYFMYKQSWRTVLWTMLGLGIFLLIVPSLVLGVGFNAECLAMWWHRIVSPFVTKGEAGASEINQSLVGLMMRLFTAPKDDAGIYDPHFDVHLLVRPASEVARLAKVISIGLVGLLALFCRTKSKRRDDPRMLGEFSLVVLTMLFVSERSWKHHYVTLLLPYTYLMYRVGMPALSRRARILLASGLALSCLLMASTSSEIGGLFVNGVGHKLAQAYGMFLASGFVLYGLTAWRVVVEGKLPAPLAEPSPPEPTE